MKNTLLHPYIDIIVDSVDKVKIIEDVTGKTVKYVMNNWNVNILRQIGNE